MIVAYLKSRDGAPSLTIQYDYLLHWAIAAGVTGMVFLTDTEEVVEPLDSKLLRHLLNEAMGGQIERIVVAHHMVLHGIDDRTMPISCPYQLSQLPAAPLLWRDTE